MIKGVGTDLVETSRIKDLLDRHGSNFIRRILTHSESLCASERRDPVPFIAGRWAAKEAISKALGCGIGVDCAWTDMEILPDNSGRPQAKLSGKGAETASKLGAKRIHLSISHERGHAIATAILE
jgi:holo-[acyl-carrier protein] synthase